MYSDLVPVVLAIPLFTGRQSRPRNSLRNDRLVHLDHVIFSRYVSDHLAATCLRIQPMEDGLLNERVSDGNVENAT